MPASDLTTLASLKAWLGIATTANDAMLTPLVSSVSRSIYSMMQRPAILPASYSETLNGNNSDRVPLRNFPVIAVSSLYVDGCQEQAAPALPSWPTGGAGWVLEAVDPTPPSRPASLFLRGGRFRRGVQNIAISYTAGYQIGAEAATVPNASPWQVTAAQPLGAWASDGGVAYAAGGALTRVAGIPAQGQYALGGTPGVYTFAAADAGASVLLTYGFIPQDLAQAAMEWAAYCFRSADHIGLRSKSLGGQETISYEVGAATARVAALIQPYRRVAL
jgi:hypothetical protein